MVSWLNCWTRVSGDLGSDFGSGMRFHINLLCQAVSWGEGCVVPSEGRQLRRSKGDGARRKGESIE